MIEKEIEGIYQTFIEQIQNQTFNSTSIIHLKLLQNAERLKPIMSFTFFESVFKSISEYITKLIQECEEKISKENFDLTDIDEKIANTKKCILDK